MACGLGGNCTHMRLIHHLQACVTRLLDLVGVGRHFFLRREQVRHLLSSPGPVRISFFIIIRIIII
jgi:hypothetical protein